MHNYWVRDFWAPPFPRRRSGAAVSARGHLGTGRLGAVLIKIDTVQVEAGLMKKIIVKQT